MSHLFSYWNIIAQYTNPFKILWSGILFAVLAFLIILVVLICFRKKILVKRRHWILRCFAISYFIIIPIFSVYTGFKWGVLHGLQKDITAHLPAYTEGLDGIFRSKVDGDISGLPQLSTDEYIDILSEVIYKEYLSTLDQVSDEGVSGKVGSWFRSLIVNSHTIAFYIKKTIHKTVEDKLGLEKEITKEVMETRIDQLLNEGLFHKIAATYIDRIFGGLKNHVLLIFLMVILLPVIEIIIAIKLNCNQTDKKAVSLQGDQTL